MRQVRQSSTIHRVRLALRSSMVARIYGAPGGQTIFNDTSTADHASITNDGAGASHRNPGQTTFNGTSTAANASIRTRHSTAGQRQTFTYIDCRSRDHQQRRRRRAARPSSTIHRLPTAQSLSLMGEITGGGAIVFNGASTGGTARVKVFDNGHLDISGPPIGCDHRLYRGLRKCFLRS